MCIVVLKKYKEIILCAELLDLQVIYLRRILL